MNIVIGFFNYVYIAKRPALKQCIREFTWTQKILNLGRSCVSVSIWIKCDEAKPWTQHIYRIDTNPLQSYINRCVSLLLFFFFFLPRRNARSSLFIVCLNRFENFAQSFDLIVAFKILKRVNFLRAKRSTSYKTIERRAEAKNYKKKRKKIRKNTTYNLCKGVAVSDLRNSYHEWEEQASEKKKK